MCADALLWWLPHLPAIAGVSLRSLREVVRHAAVGTLDSVHSFVTGPVSLARPGPFGRGHRAIGSNTADRDDENPETATIYVCLSSVLYCTTC